MLVKPAGEEYPETMGVGRAINRGIALLFRAVRAAMPENRLGDKGAALIDFVLRHKRLPNKPLLNDVLHRIKTSDEILDPLRVFVSDKQFVKLYVRSVVGEQYNVPTLAVLRSPDEVYRYDFPAACCIKPTQASGYKILRADGEPLDLQRIASWFAINHYHKYREANYKLLRPKVIVEPLLFQQTSILDFRFFCFEGKAKLIMVDCDWTPRNRQFFDLEWNRQPYSLRYPLGGTLHQKPANFAAMLDVAEKLAAGFGLIRIDLYSDGETCLVGEITNCQGSALSRFIPASAEREASALIFG